MALSDTHNNCNATPSFNYKDVRSIAIVPATLGHKFDKSHTPTVSTALILFKTKAQ